MLRDDGSFNLTNYHALDQSGKEKDDDVAHELIAFRLIIKNSLCICAQTYLKDQYFMNQ